jgi:glycosyltransferase involved in cell wall biosynthesis
MGRGALVLYLNTPENAEVAGGAGIPFERDDLARQLRLALDLSEAEREQWRSRAVERVRERYSWDAVTDDYEKLLLSLVGR